MREEHFAAYWRLPFGRWKTIHNLISWSRFFYLKGAQTIKSCRHTSDSPPRKYCMRTGKITQCLCDQRETFFFFRGKNWCNCQVQWQKLFLLAVQNHHCRSDDEPELSEHKETSLHIKGILTFITSIYIFETKTCVWSLQPSLLWWAEVLCRYGITIKRIQHKANTEKDASAKLMYDRTHHTSWIAFTFVDFTTGLLGRSSLAFCCFLPPDLLAVAYSPVKDCILLAVAPCVYCWTQRCHSTLATFKIKTKISRPKKYFTFRQQLKQKTYL